jgi:segregation and condensation protein B
MTYMRVVWDDDMADEEVNEPGDLPPNEQPPRKQRDRAGASSATAERSDSEQPDGPVEDSEEASTDAADTTDTEAKSDEPALDAAILESLLFSTHHPLTTQRLTDLLGAKAGVIRKAIKDLNKGYEETNRSFRIEQVAGGYQMLTLPEYGEYLQKLLQKEADAKLTKAALETLAIIAYKQPILRAELESIRGVACGETIRSLMEKHLVKIAGRAELPGRPILYGTTKRFLELFGLNTLKDLPQAEEDLKPKG